MRSTKYQLRSEANEALVTLNDRIQSISTDDPRLSSQLTQYEEARYFVDRNKPKKALEILAPQATGKSERAKNIRLGCYAGACVLSFGVIVWCMGGIISDTSPQSKEKVMAELAQQAQHDGFRGVEPPKSGMDAIPTKFALTSDQPITVDLDLGRCSLETVANVKASHEAVHDITTYRFEMTKSGSLSFRNLADLQHAVGDNVCQALVFSPNN